MYNTFIIQESLMDSNLRNIEKTPLGTIKFVAVLQEANRPNRNHRIYPKETLVRALADPYVQERLRTNSWYGEAGHPLDTSLARQTNIMHDNIAFLIHKVWWEGNLLMGECETANTSRGKDMAGLIEQNSRVAFSLRAQGSLNEPDSMSGIRTVAPNLKIITFDWVINPSHDVAFITSLCNETKESMFNSAKPTAAHISEACALCESGQMFAVEENIEPIVENYIPGYRKSVRAANEIYVREDNDTLLVESIKNDCAEVQNGNVTKKVVLEDFLTQDIRSSICQLNEGVGKYNPDIYLRNKGTGFSDTIKNIALNTVGVLSYLFLGIGMFGYTQSSKFNENFSIVQNNKILKNKYINIKSLMLEYDRTADKEEKKAIKLDIKNKLLEFKKAFNNIKKEQADIKKSKKLTPSLAESVNNEDNDELR